MTKLISDCQLLLANRLGSNLAPTDNAELAKRRKWFWSAISSVYNDEEYMWFSKTLSTDTTVVDQPSYSIPTYFRHPIEIKVDGNIYTKTTKEDDDKERQTAVVSLPSIQIDWEYYIYDDKIYLLPIPTSTPDPVTVTLAQTSGTATATSTTAHGYVVGDHVTIAGATPTAYNGEVEILTVPTTLTFTFSIASATTSPATGTITATKRNIEIWHYQEAAEPTAEGDSILIPDKYIDIPVSYAEGRYWSSAHKRGKAADAFTEYETLVNKVKRENFRRKFGQNEESGT
jgi:hypothetical protein